MPSLKVFGAAGAIILLGAIASWFGLAHGCKQEIGGGNTITGTITVDSSLVNAVDPSATLFIVARRADAAFGPPLAVQRIDRPAFPFPYTLSSDDVMRPGIPFEGRVIVNAKLDKDGKVGSQPGDLEGEFAGNPTTVGQRNVDIILSTIR